MNNDKRNSMIPNFTVLCLSGGLDSVTLGYAMQSEGINVHPMILEYGQTHLREVDYAKIHCKRMGWFFTEKRIPRLHGSALTDGCGGWVVQNRNAVILSLAVNLAVHCRADSVSIGCNKDDAEMFPDCRPEFFDAYNAMLKKSEIPVVVCTPFIGQSKAQIVRLARELKVPIEETWSCYLGGEKPCGECPACKKLAVALASK